jgi:hypothetical protein
VNQNEEEISMKKMVAFLMAVSFLGLHRARSRR